jgi:hypothetical protein
VVVARFEEGVTNVLEVNPAVEQSSLLKTKVGTRALRTPAHRFPVGDGQGPQSSDRASGHVDELRKDGRPGKAPAAAHHGLVEGPEFVVNVRRPRIHRFGPRLALNHSFDSD